MPPRVARSVIASEDAPFGDPVALNVLAGVGRAAWSLLRGEADPGGATIDQQLVAGGAITPAHARVAFAEPLALDQTPPGRRRSR